MDGHKKQFYERELLGRRADLMGQVQVTESYVRERDSEAMLDPTDLAAETQAKSVVALTASNNHELLLSIEAAVERLERGEYGKCLHCGEHIAEKRLEAIPWTAHCLPCQEINEHGAGE